MNRREELSWTGGMTDDEYAESVERSNPPNLVTAAVAAWLLGITPRGVHHLMRTGRLPNCGWKRRRRFYLPDVEALACEREQCRRDRLDKQASRRLYKVPRHRLSADRAMRALECSRDTLERLTRRGLLLSVRVSGRPQFSRSAITRLARDGWPGRRRRRLPSGA